MKIKTTVSIIFIIIPFCFVDSQSNYSVNKEQALKEWENGNYTTAIKVYHKACRAWTPLPSDFYALARLYALSRKQNRALHFLQKAVDFINYAPSYLTNDTCFYGLHSNKKWQVIVQETRLHYLGRDAELKKTMEELDSLDQFYRTKIVEMVELHGYNSQERIDLEKKMNEQDSLNMEVFTKIFLAHGYPGKTLVGNKKNVGMRLINHNMSLDELEAILPSLRKMAKKKEVSWKNIALLEDIVLVKRKKKQKYGIQYKYDAELKKYTLHPIENIKRVNKKS